MPPTTYRGSCHCGALGVSYRTSLESLPLRSCQCSFCQRHQARYSSDPPGRIRFLSRRPDALQRYRFAAQTIDFILCRHCGCYLGAMQEGRLACVNVNSWQHPGEADLMCFDKEAAAERRERRERAWSPCELLECQIRPPSPDEPLLQAYFAELSTVLGTFNPDLGPTAHPLEMTAPQGVFMLLTEQGRALACGGLKTHAPGVGEIKRMYIIPEARGRGLGRELLLELERQARRLALSKIVLDTATPLEAAQSLYLNSGYQEVEAFNDTPYAGRWFAKEL